jgi:hypothetical protein
VARVTSPPLHDQPLLPHFVIRSLEANFVGADPAPVQTSVRDRPVLHRGPQYVSVLGVDTARAGARDMCGTNAAARALADLGADKA